MGLGFVDVMLLPSGFCCEKLLLKFETHICVLDCEYKLTDSGINSFFFLLWVGIEIVYEALIHQAFLLSVRNLFDRSCRFHL